METLSQILVVIFFVVMFVIITIGKIHRYIPALVGAALTLLVLLFVLQSSQACFDVLNLSEIFKPIFWIPGHEHLESHGVNWQTLIFIAGMMIMVEGLAKVGFFRWMCLVVAKVVHYKVVPILVTFTVLAGFLSMFIDSITVMLFLATVTIEISRMLKFDPVPVIISEIFASNIGGSATMSGDPPNIIIGTSLGYTFTDFIANTGIIALAGMAVCLIFIFFSFRKTLNASYAKNNGSEAPKYPEPREAITNRGLFLLHTGIFLVVIVLLITHAQTGISVALIGVIAAALTLAAVNRETPHIMKNVDWRTLLFFIGLFICVGGLEETGALNLLANFIGKVCGGNLTAAISIILWLSAIASSLVDNIPFAATMVPVISQLAQTQGMNLHPIAWALALGTDIGGNGTPIGASANVVGTAISEREGYPISWGKYLRYGIPLMILVIGLCNLLLLWKY
ncbi:MAG: ArsB/NhaD family transporter [Dehalococcoidales bacterium]|jgi:Na+/H+ antiporter NhaD/arsenite permease-like protein